MALYCRKQELTGAAFLQSSHTLVTSTSSVRDVALRLGVRAALLCQSVVTESQRTGQVTKMLNIIISYK